MPDFSTLYRKTKTTWGKTHATVLTPRLRRSIRLRTPPASGGFDFLVYFADSPELLYQLKQWIVPLENLAANGSRVVFVLNNALSARELGLLTTLPILLTRSMAEIEQFVEAQGVRGVFYVNNSQANFTALRMTQPVHIHLNHGESEKTSMVSNQLKAYDYAFVAGDAAANRILSKVDKLDPAHLVKIGRPQLDLDASLIPAKAENISVLYAPTWEGDSRAMAYSSLNSIGMRLVQELVADDRFTLVFRPHPKTGTWSRETARSLRLVTDEIKANAKNGQAGRHHIDTGMDPTASIAGSDIVIADNSAMAMDAIGLGVHLLAVSPDPTATLQQRPADLLSLYGAAPTIGADHRGNFAETILAIVNSPIQENQVAFQRHLFGDPVLGTGTERFISACRRIIGRQDPVLS